MAGALLISFCMAQVLPDKRKQGAWFVFVEVCYTFAAKGFI